MVIALLGWLVGLLLAGGDGLTWDVDPPCPTVERARASLAAMLSKPIDAGARARVKIVRALPDRWVATIDVASGASLVSRTLEAETCEAVSSASLVVIAVALEPFRLSEAVDTPADTLAPRGPDKAARTAPKGVNSADSSASLGRRDPPSAADMRVFVRLGGAWATLPGVRPNLGVGVAAAWPQARLELAGHHSFGGAKVHDSSRTAGARIGLTAGSVTGCWVPQRGRFSFPVCLGLEAGAMTARGFGLARSRVAQSAWVGLVPQIRGAWAAVPRRLTVTAGLEFPIGLRRPTFSIDDFKPPLAQAGAVGVRFNLGLEFTFFAKASVSRRSEKRR